MFRLPWQSRGTYDEWAKDGLEAGYLSTHCATIWISRRSNRVVASLTVENYVKTIALIAARDPSGGPVGTGELAQALNVSPGTVTGMLKTLSEGNLATYTPYEGARLTDSGQRLAMKVIRRHRLLERFLAETLTMSWDEVHEEAEHMEHAASERLIDRIDAYLGYPAVDPHGDPIPRADGSLAETEGVPLARCQAGQHFQVARVMDQDPAFLRYLSECGLELNSTGELLENRPEARALLVCKLGGRTVALGLAAAGKVLVIVDSPEDPSSIAAKKMRGN